MWLFHGPSLVQPHLCTILFQVSIPALERSLHQYTLNASEAPFDMKSVPLAAVEPLVIENVPQKAVPEGTLLSTPGEIAFKLCSLHSVL